MNKIYSQHRFTLVELLIVVGIIAVLAGLVLPAVIGGIQQGRITQAKSDLASIMMALKGVEGTYGKMVNASGSSLSFNGKSASFDSDSGVFKIGSSCTDAYNAFIMELTMPSHTGLTALNINKRKIKFLEPKPNFNPDPSTAYDATTNSPHLWRDPWGNPYVILLNSTGADSIAVPNHPHDKTVAAKAAGYSFGPNGTDNHGDNIDKCSNSDHKLHDDITTWD